MKSSKDFRVVGKYAPIVLYKCLVGDCKEYRRSPVQIEAHIIEAHNDSPDTKTPKTRA